MNYHKQPINIKDQIALLRQRGLQIANEEKAEHYLSNISYYRLRAYTYPFQDNQDPNHPFTQKITFEQIIELYVFDRRLRLLLFDALEKIEIALRTKIIYTWALTNGSHWHENADLYRDAGRFSDDMDKLHEEIERSTETFIKHYKNTYTNPVNPPCWMSLEVASFGLLSKLFENLKKGTEKKFVTMDFGLTKPEILESWMHSFAQLRNTCAHHGRVWNRRYTAMPIIPTNAINPFLEDTGIYPNKLYANLCCITYILNIISPNNNFNKRLHELMQSCSLTDFKEMGFTQDWQNEPLWKIN